MQAIFNPTPLPALNTPAAPFHDSADQTKFITQWIQDSNHLGQMATTIENNGFTGDVAGLVQQIQTYATNSNAFDQAQGGLWSARFWNKFRSDGTSGAAADSLVEGLRPAMPGKSTQRSSSSLRTRGISAPTTSWRTAAAFAAVVAVVQATAVTPNNTAGLAWLRVRNSPAAAEAPAAAAAAGLTATDLFNDATTREIGGVCGREAGQPDRFGSHRRAADADGGDAADQRSFRSAHPDHHQPAQRGNCLGGERNSPTGTLVLGADLGQFVGRAINNIHRDIIDIAQGDAGVQAIFNPTPLPDLDTPPAPFHDSADQTAFVTQWIQDSNHLGQMATTIENNGFTGDIAGLVQQIQTYATNSNAFDQAQGGLWSARFWNEFRSDGTSGTAAAALIEGLQNHNAGEVNAAVEQLAANSGDVGTNNVMADGGSYAAVVAAAQATAVTPVTPEMAAPAPEVAAVMRVAVVVVAAQGVALAAAHSLPAISILKTCSTTPPEFSKAGCGITTSRWEIRATAPLAGTLRISRRFRPD